VNFMMGTCEVSLLCGSYQVRMLLTFLMVRHLSARSFTASLSLECLHSLYTGHLRGLFLPSSPNSHVDSRHERPIGLLRIQPSLRVRILDREVLLAHSVTRLVGEQHQVLYS